MEFLRALLQIWLMLIAWLRQFFARNPSVARIGNSILSVGRALLAIVLIFWQLLLHLSKSQLMIIQLVRNNMFAVCLVLIGIAFIGILLTSPAPAPVLQVASVATPQELRPIYSIGAILSLTGKHERRGNAMRRGYELAITTYNNAGGININGEQHNLALNIYDDESNPVRAAEVTELMFAYDKPSMLLAPYSSALARPVMVIAQQHNIPVIAPVASSAGMDGVADAAVFLLQSPPFRHLREAAELFVQHVKQQHATAKTAKTSKKNKKGKKQTLFTNGYQPRVALVATSDPHAHAVIEDVKVMLFNEGITDIVTLDVTAPATLYTEAAKQLAKVDGLFMAAYAPGALRVLETIATNGYNVPFLAMTHCAVAKISYRQPAVAEGALCALHWQPEAKFVSTPPLDQSFVTDYYKAYGSNLSHQAAAAAAAIQVIAAALKRKAITKAKLQDEIARININTFYGPIKFDAHGRNVAKPMVLSQIVQSRYIPVAPRKIALQQVNYNRPELAQ